MTHSFSHSRPGRLLYELALWGCVLVGGLWTLCSALTAEAGVGECADLGSLVGVSFGPEGQQLAEWLVRTQHPHRETICAELGLDCDDLTNTFTRFPVEDCQDHNGSAVCFSSSEVEGAFESFADDFLESPSHRQPFGGWSLACYEHPKQCNGLPVHSFELLRKKPLPTGQSIASLVTTSQGWCRTVAFHAHPGLAFAVGVSRLPEVPPQA